MKAIYYLQQVKTGKNFRIEEDQEVTIGRAFDNNLLVDDESVSRHHAVIKWKKGQMYLSDLGSTNGSYVNKEKLENDYFVELNFADEVIIGKVPFKILDEETVIGKNFGGNAPAKTIVVAPDKMNRILNKDDFSKN